MKLKNCPGYKSVVKTIKAIRRLQLKNRNFTIISNKCWGGGVLSQYYDLRKNSPTVGLYFFADDYIKFVYDLKYYVNQPLRFISLNESKYKEILEKRSANPIIGILDDVEIVFLHYHSCEEAKAKWERRCKRINWNNLFIKFSEMNLCTQGDMRAFDELAFANKVMFTKIPRDEFKCAVYYPGYEKEDQIKLDTEPINKCINITKFLNKKPCTYEGPYYSCD